jgi:Ser/Thr protein kinase RdoA (MazF antagonist)
MTDYADHLANLHANFAAPEVLIADAAREITASPIASRQRIVHGEANEVYRLAFGSGLEVILRIARRAPGIFEKEAWAIGLCRALGVLAPEVLSIQRRQAGDETLELCVLEKLPGERLMDSLSLPHETLRSICRELGEQVGLIHSIGMNDLGDGACFFEGDTDDTLATGPEFIRLGIAAGLATPALEAALRLYETTIASGVSLERRLTHNDLRACHVMVHDGRVSGLIDFGQASMDTPINDLAKWDFWEAPHLPAAWLEVGYGDRSLFTDGYRERFEALRIANALWALRWYSLTGYTAGVTRAASHIARYLHDLGLA